MEKEYQRMTTDELMQRLHNLQTSGSPEKRIDSREIEIQAVLQELEVYQIELEMQNRELRESQEALLESQERYLNLYDFAPVGYLTLTENGTIHEINLTACMMLGVERQWLIGRSLAPWILGSDLTVFRNHLKSCKDDLKKVESRLHVVRRNKEVFPVGLASLCETRSSGKIFYKTIMADFTEREGMERSLKDGMNKLEEERDLREHFVSALTHDLRTPLMVAKMGAEFLNRKPSNDLALPKYSAKIIKSVDRIDHMIQDLLDANRIRSGEKLPITFTEFELTALLKETITDLSDIYGDHFVLVAKNPVYACWSKHGLRRIIENLASNAIKYGAKDKKVTISTAEDTNHRIIITVQNFGIPILKKDQATLFNQFRRADNADASGKKGWGIGLTLVKGLVEAHGGEIHVESDLEKGTTFSVVLPLKKYADSGIQAELL